MYIYIYIYAFIYLSTRPWTGRICSDGNRSGVNRGHREHKGSLRDIPPKENIAPAPPQTIPAISPK